MKDIQIMSLVFISLMAVLIDMSTGKIPNGLIFTGIIWAGTYQVFANGTAGVILFLGGVSLPLIVFSSLYYFRMIGAGDIKLLCVAGGFLGPTACFSCIVSSILFGGMISLILMIRHHNFYQQFKYLSDYIDHYSNDKKWTPYLAGTSENARFCFSIPVFLGILCQIGGMI